MANGKSNGVVIAVVVTSVLLVGTAAFFIIKGLRAKKDLKKTGEGSQGTPQTSPQGTPQNTPQETQQASTQYTPPSTTPPTTQTGSTTTGATTNTSQAPNWSNASFSFPIMFGQRGSNVKNLQLMLQKFDKNILPKYGADGSFGSETSSALNRVIGKTVVSGQSDIDAINNAINRKLATNISILTATGRLF